MEWKRVRGNKKEDWRSAREKEACVVSSRATCLNSHAASYDVSIRGIYARRGVPRRLPYGNPPIFTLVPVLGEYRDLSIAMHVFGRGRSSRDKFGRKYRSDRFIRSSINGGLLSWKKKWKRKRPILSDIYRSTRVDVSSCLTRGEKSGERRNTSEISEENVLSTRNERADGARLLVGGW